MALYSAFAGGVVSFVLPATLAWANPQGQQVLRGQATFQSNGNTLTVTNTPGAAINWQSFSIKANETTHFQQSNSSSSVLNRVVNNNPSELLGNLTSNGKVVLINPFGITVGRGAAVDTAGFTASTLNITDADWANGKLRFQGNSLSGDVKVDGVIRSANGDVMLFAPNVTVGSDALVKADNGNVVIGAGQKVEVTGRGLEGIRFEIQSVENRAVNLGNLQGNAVGVFAGTLRHSGLIQAQTATQQGGRVVLSAVGNVELSAGSKTMADAAPQAAPGAASGLQGPANGGQISITSALGNVSVGQGALVSAQGAGGGAGGQIVLQALQGNVWVEQQARILADGTPAGSIRIQAAQTAKVAGQLSAQSPAGAGNISGGNSSAPISINANAVGGKIQVLGNRVTLAAGASVNVSGDAGGGQIRIGGDFQGSNAAIQNAATTDVAPGVTLVADGRAWGDGGKVIVWADDATHFAGTLWARGGEQGGNGGFGETSGKGALYFRGSADLAAPRGRTGTLLLDPDSITVSDTLAVNNGALTGGTINAAAGTGAFTIDWATVQSIGNTINILLQANQGITLAGATSILIPNTLTLQTTMGGPIAGGIDATAYSGTISAVAIGLLANATGGNKADVNIGPNAAFNGAYGVIISAAGSVGIGGQVASSIRDVSVTAGGPINFFGQGQIKARGLSSNVALQSGGGITGSGGGGPAAQVSTTGVLSIRAGGDVGSLAAPLTVSASTVSVDTSAATLGGNIYLTSATNFSGSFNTGVDQQTVSIVAPAFIIGSSLDVKGDSVTYTAANGITINPAGGATSLLFTDSTGGGSLTLNAGSGIYNLQTVDLGVNSSFNGPTYNYGTINILSGDLTVSSMTLQSGRIAVGGGQTFTVSSGDLVNQGLLSGSGVIAVSGTLFNAGPVVLGGVTLASGGTIAPGSDTSIGSLTINAAGVALQSGSTLAIKVGQNSDFMVVSDFLNVNASLTSYGSTLAVSELGGYWLNKVYFSGSTLTYASAYGFSGSINIGSVPLGVTLSGGIPYTEGGPVFTLAVTGLNEYWLPTTPAGGNWNTDTNWSRGKPWDGADVTINTGPGNLVLIDETTAATPGSIYIGAGNTLSIAAGGSMTLDWGKTSSLYGKISLGAPTTSAPDGGQLTVGRNDTLTMDQNSSVTGKGTLTVYGYIYGESTGATNATIDVGTLNIPRSSYDSAYFYGEVHADYISADNFSLSSGASVYSGNDPINSTFTVRKSYVNGNTDPSNSAINYFANIDITQASGDLFLDGLQANSIHLAAPKGLITLAPGATWSAQSGSTGLLSITALGLDATQASSSLKADQLVLRNEDPVNGNSFVISGNPVNGNYHSVGTIAATLASGSVTLSLATGGTLTVGSVTDNIGMVSGITLGQGGALSLEMVNFSSPGWSSQININQPIVLTGVAGTVAGGSGGTGGAVTIHSDHELFVNSTISSTGGDGSAGAAALSAGEVGGAGGRGGDGGVISLMGDNSLSIYGGAQVISQGGNGGAGGAGGKGLAGVDDPLPGIAGGAGNTGGMGGQGGDGGTGGSVTLSAASGNGGWVYLKGTSNSGTPLGAMVLSLGGNGGASGAAGDGGRGGYGNAGTSSDGIGGAGGRGGYAGMGGGGGDISINATASIYLGGGAAVVSRGGNGGDGAQGGNGVDGFTSTLAGAPGGAGSPAGAGGGGGDGGSGGSISVTGGFIRVDDVTYGSGALIQSQGGNGGNAGMGGQGGAGGAGYNGLFSVASGAGAAALASGTDGGNGGQGGDGGNGGNWGVGGSITLVENPNGYGNMYIGWGATIQSAPSLAGHGTGPSAPGAGGARGTAGSYFVGAATTAGDSGARGNVGPGANGGLEGWAPWLSDGDVSLTINNTSSGSQTLQINGAIRSYGNITLGNGAGDIELLGSVFTGYNSSLFLSTSQYSSSSGAITSGDGTGQISTAHLVVVADGNVELSNAENTIRKDATLTSNYGAVTLTASSGGSGVLTINSLTAGIGNSTITATGGENLAVNGLTLNNAHATATLNAPDGSVRLNGTFQGTAGDGQRSQVYTQSGLGGPTNIGAEVGDSIFTLQDMDLTAGASLNFSVSTYGTLSVYGNGNMTAPTINISTYWDSGTYSDSRESTIYFDNSNYRNGFSAGTLFAGSGGLHIWGDGARYSNDGNSNIILGRNIHTAGGGNLSGVLMSADTLSGAAGGTLFVDSGNLDVYGTNVLGNNLVIGAATASNPAGALTINNGASLTFNGDPKANTNVFDVAGAVTVLNGGTLTIAPVSATEQGFTLQFQYGSTLKVDGTMVSDVMGFNTLTVGGNLTGSGLINIVSGTLELAGRTGNSEVPFKQISLTGDSAVLLVSNGDHYVGTIDNGSGDMPVGSAVSIDSGSASLTVFNAFFADTVSVSGGTLGLSYIDGQANANTLVQSGGSIYANTLSVTGGFTQTGSLSYFSANSLSVQSGSLVTVGGIVTVDGNADFRVDAMTIGGTLSAQNLSIASYTDGAALTLGGIDPGNGPLPQLWLSQADLANITLLNAGGQLTFGRYAFDTVALGQGDITVASPLSFGSTRNVGTLSLVGAASINLNAPLSLLDDASLPTGTIKLLANGGTVGQAGGAVSAQTLTVLASSGVSLTDTGNYFTQLSVTNSGSGDINIANSALTLDLGSSSNGGNLSVKTAGSLTVTGSVASDTGAVTLQSAAGMTLASGASISAGAAGDAAILLVNSGTGVFENYSTNAGALSTPNGYWQVWSADPGADTVGNLAPDYLQYNAIYPNTTVAASNANGLLYSIAPTLSIALGGLVARTYNGLADTSAPVTAGNLAASSAINNDVISIGWGAANYDDGNAGSGKTVTVGSLSIMATTLGGVPVYGYTLGNTSVSYTGGSINKADATVTANSGVLTYNGGTQSVSGFSTSGLVAGDTLAGVTASGASGRNVGSYDSTVSGTDTNYNLTLVNGGLSITPASLTLSAASDSRAYNGTTLSSGTVTITGLQSPDSISSLSQAFLSKNVQGAGASTLVVSGGYVVNDGNPTLGSNYSVTLNTAAGTITPATVSLSASKTYDGTTGLTGGAVTLATGVSGEALGFSGATANSKNVGAGNYINAITLLDGTGLASNYQLPTLDALNAPVNITQRALTISANGINKVYDGTNSASVSLGDNRVAGDTLSGAYGSATYVAGKNVGMGLAINVAGISLTGLGSGNYSYSTVASASANIAQATVTLGSGNVVKTYDSTTSAAGTLTLLGGTIYSGDTLSSAGATYAFTNANAGTGKTVTVAGGSVTDGNSGGNYFYNYAANTTSTINKAALMLSAVTESRGYNGTTLSSGSVNISGLKGADSVTGLSQVFDSKNAGSRTLSVAGGYTVNDSNSGGNYTLTTANASGSISQASITLGSGNVVKTYDSTTSAAGTLTLLGGTIYSGDTLSSAGATYAFTNANAGTGKTVTVAGGSVTDGNSGGNYFYNYAANTTSTINKAALMLSAVTESRGYNGTTLSSGSVNISGLKGADSVTGLSQVFDSKNAGSRTLSVAGGYTVNDSNSGGNYTLTTANASGSISQASITLGSGNVVKTYDSTTSAAGTLTLLGGTIYSGDTLSSAGATYAFTNANAGTGKTVTVAGGSVTDGNGGGNYFYNYAANTASIINKAALTLSAVTDSRGYNGTTLSSGSVNISGLKGADSVTGLAQVFDSKNAGSLTLSIAGGYSVNDGNSGGNYTLATANASGSISQATITLGTGNVVKTYDSTTSAAGTLTLVGGTIYSGDTLSSAGATYAFTNANAGIGNKTVSVTGGAVTDGNSGANYLYNYAANTTSTINKAALTLSAVTDSRGYNGTTLSSGSVNISGLKGADSVTGLAQVFDSKNAGSLTLSIAGGYSVNDGNSGGNYTLATANASGSISQATITLGTGNVVKTYDSTTSAAGTLTLVGGTIYSGDTLSSAGATYAFTNANAGIGNKTVSVTGGAVTDGNSGANYLYNYAANTTSTINKAALTLSAVTDSRDYNATTLSTGTVTLLGLKGNDSVSGASQVFDRKNVGSRTLSVAAGYSINDGNSGGNYAPTLSSASGSIAPATLSVSTTGINKVYDGTTAATINYGYAPLGSDTLSVAGSASFGDRNVGTSKPVSVSGITLGGADAGNYVLASTTASTTANITQLGLATWTGAGGNALWSNPNNWTALPDGSNVLAVSINGASGGVKYDNTVAANTTLQTLSGNSLLALAGGSLSVSGSAFTGGLSLSGGTLAVGNALTVTGPTITQSGGLFTVGGLASFNAGLGTVALASTSNTFSGGVLLNAGSGALAAGSAYTVGGNIASGGALQLGGPSVVLGGGPVGTLSVSGPLTINVTGSLTQGAAVNIGGISTLSAGSISLPMLNTWGAAVNFNSGGAVSLGSAGAIAVAGTSGGLFTLSSNGTVTESAPLNVAGASVTAPGQTVNLASFANDLGSFTFNAANVQVKDANSLSIGGIASGVVAVTAATGVTGTGTLSAAGLSVVLSGTGSASLFNADVSGSTSFTTIGAGSYQSITYQNASSTGTLGGTLAATGSVSLAFKNAGLALPQIQAGTLAVSAGGTVSQSGAISTGGATFNVTGHDLLLSNSGNHLTAVAVDAFNADITDAGAIDVMGTVAGGLHVNAAAVGQSTNSALKTGSATLAASSGIAMVGMNQLGTLSASSGGAISVNDTGASFTLGYVSTPGSLTVQSGGALLQGSGTSLSSGSLDLVALSVGTGAQPMEFAAPAARFIGVAGGVHAHSAQAFTLAGLGAADDSSVASNQLLSVGGTVNVEGALTISGLGIGVQAAVIADHATLNAGGGNLVIGGGAVPVRVQGAGAVTLLGHDISLLGGTVKGAVAEAVSGGGVTVNAAGNFVISGGSGNGALAQVSAFGPLSVTVGGAMDVIGGTGSGAFAKLDPSVQSPLTVNARSVSLRGGIGPGAYAAIVSEGDVTVSAPGGISMVAGTGLDADAVVISYFGKVTLPSCNGCVKLNTPPLGNGVTDVGVLGGDEYVSFLSSGVVGTKEILQFQEVFDVLVDRPVKQKNKDDIVIETVCK